MKLRLRLPGDFSGGIILFMIVVAITFIQLYFFKTRALAGGAFVINHKSICDKSGGKWKGSCCDISVRKSLPSTVHRCASESARGVPFP